MALHRSNPFTSQALTLPPPSHPPLTTRSPRTHPCKPAQQGSKSQLTYTYTTYTHTFTTYTHTFTTYTHTFTHLPNGVAHLVCFAVQLLLLLTYRGLLGGCLLIARPRCRLPHIEGACVIGAACHAHASTRCTWRCTCAKHMPMHMHMHMHMHMLMHMRMRMCASAHVHVHVHMSPRTSAPLRLSAREPRDACAACREGLPSSSASSQPYLP